MDHTTIKVSKESHRKILKVRGWRMHKRADSLTIDGIIAEVFQEELDRIEIEKAAI